MTGCGRTGERSYRCRAAKAVATVLLAFLSGSLGCQGTADLLRDKAANNSPAHTAAAEAAPKSIPTPGPNQASSAILQVGATQVVPLGADTASPSVVSALMETASAPGDPDRSDPVEGKRIGQEPAVASTQTSSDSAVAVEKSETAATERKWTAAPDADADKSSVGGKRGSQSSKVYQVDRSLPSPTAGMVTPVIPAPKNVAPVTLAGALRQAGAENPVIAIAQQAVQRALGLQLQARVLLLPNVNVGANYDDHNGPLQASFGGIRKVDRDAVYYGLGANTVAAETIKIPGLLISTALTDVIFAPRAASYDVSNRRFAATATRNDIFLDVSTTYLALMNAETRLAVIRQSEKDFEEVVRLTKAYYQAKFIRKADADRAEADRLALRYEELHEQQEVAVASADLAQLLNLDPSTRLVTGDIPLQVVQFVDPVAPLPKLLELAERNHPAILAAAANVRAGQVRVHQEQARPLLPILWTGFSAGEFGGGSVASSSGNVFNPHTGNENLAPPQPAGHTVPKFGKISGRMDYDVFAYWQLQNLGFGNIALIRRRRAEVGQAQAERLRIINDVREQVSVAFNRSAEHFRAIAVQRQRVQEATEGFQLDLIRLREGAALPLEVLDNAVRLREAREALLAAVIGFDRAQFELFVALGQPPSLVVEDDKPPMVAAASPPSAPANAPPLEQLPQPHALPEEKK